MARPRASLARLGVAVAFASLEALRVAAAAEAGSGAASESAGWNILFAQTPDSRGTDTYPSIRYAHSLASYNGSLISTHGYFYDRERSDPVWLSDTWALGVAQHAWRRLSTHLPQSEAYAAYSAGRTPRAPCGRFGHAVAVLDGAVWMYGGHDGGYSRTNRQDYRPGNDFDELWRLDLETQAWTLESHSSSGSSPGKRYLHSLTAVGDQLLLYGGSADGQGDVWSYSPAERQWQQLAAEAAPEAGGPGRRMAGSITGWAAGGGGGGGGAGAGFVLYGGRSVTANGSNVVHADAWFFDLAAAAWRSLEAHAAAASGGGDAAAAPALPAGRLYHAAFATPLPVPAATRRGRPTPSARVGVVAAGTSTTPGLMCEADAWAFALDCAARRITWARLPDLPAALYDTRGAAVGGGAYLFGGHLCKLAHPGVPAYPYWYTNQVLHLDLQAVPALKALLLAKGPDGGPAACELAQPGAGESSHDDEL